MSDHIQPISIGYYDPFDVYSKLQNELNTKVRLTNLHWRKSNEDSLRSIPQLPTKFVEETPKYFDNNDMEAHFRFTDIPTGAVLEKTVRLLEVPYVRLMFIECENSDTYKSKVRPLIKEWHKSCIEKSNGPVDWYLVFYVPDSDSGDNKSRTKVFEKLKLDFNATEGDTDRCIKLKAKYSNPLEENESWNLLQNKLKSGILYSFTFRLEKLHEGLVMLNKDREKKESNLMVYLSMKEGFARQFLLLNLLEDALGEYDNLSALVKSLQNDTHFFPAENLNFSQEVTTNLMDFVSTSSLFQRSEKEVSLFKLKAYLFAKQFVILDSLSDKAPSMSISSIHVSEFLRRLHAFAAEISKLFATSAVQKLSVSEWTYRLVDDVLARDVCVKISSEASEQSDSNMSQISERFGELLLLQRSQLLKLGQSSGYNICDILSDISLDDEEDEALKYQVSYEPLKKTLGSYKSFEESYSILTGEAIKHFSISGRPRTVDALSIDVALLDYQNGNYEKAAEVFATCPDFYGSQGWEFISKSLLEIFADCLEHIDQDSEFFKNDEEDSLTKNNHLCKVYLDILSSAKSNIGKKLITPKLIEDTFKKFKELIPDDDVEYPIENLFDIKPIPTLLNSSNDTLTLEVIIKSPFKRELKLKNARILLKNENEEIFTFDTKETDVNPGANKIKFVSNHIMLGQFKLYKSIAELGNVTISGEFTDAKDFLIFTYPDNLLLDIANSTNINLTTKSISIFIHTGNSSIKNSKIRLWSKTDGFEPTSDIKAVNLSTNEAIGLAESDPDNLVLSTDGLDSFASYEIIVPYIMNAGLNPEKLDLKAQISYEIEQGERSQTVTKLLDTSFSIAVSVQDIFKNTGLYAKFSIGTADIDFPIRILSTVLQSNEKYQVSTSFETPSLIAFGEQPCSSFYKIQKKQGAKYSEDDYLTLDIRYRDLKEELKQILMVHLKTELVKVGLERYIPLFKMVLDDLKYDYTHYVTSKEIKITEPIKFDKLIIDSMSSEDIKVRTINVFEQIINSLQVPDVTQYDLRDRHLYIDVQIPSVQVVHTVEFKIDQETHYVVGTAIPATLEISSFMNGTETSNTSKKKVQFQSEVDTKNYYSLELLTNQDSWLINGKTKFKFEVDKSQTNKLIKLPDIEISLIPIKIGKIALPKIKIINEGIESKDEYLMEVDYKNENETLYIVSEAINE